MASENRWDGMPCGFNNPVVISTDTISPKDETMTAATDAHVLYLVPGAANGSLCAFT
jgi:hypothetical protein